MQIATALHDAIHMAARPTGGDANLLINIDIGFVAQALQYSCNKSCSDREQVIVSRVAKLDLNLSF